jgi:hypothetical protein
MILENLRDRHPEMFAPKPVPTLPNPRRGEGKARIWLKRLEFYRRSLGMLVIRPRILAELAALKDKADQVAQTGGYEATK